MDTIPLFDPPDPPPAPRPGTRQATGKPRWTKYAPKYPVRCDDCMQVLAESQGHGPAARQARMRRRTPDSDRLVCYDHARQWRAFDELSVKGDGK